MSEFFLIFMKLMKQKKVWLLFAVSILIICVHFVINITITKNAHEEVLSQFNNQISMYTEDAIYWAEQKEKAINNNDEDLIQELEWMEEYAQDSYLLNKQFKNDYEVGNYKNMYKDFYNLISKAAYPPPNEEHKFSFESQNISNFTLRATTEEINYILEKDITPFIQKSNNSMFLFTIYDDFNGDSSEIWKESTKRYSNYGVYYLYLLVNNFYTTILILTSCLIFGKSVSKRVDKDLKIIKNTNLTIKWFYMNFLTGLLGILLYLLIMFGVPVLLGTLTYGFGNLEYPILTYDPSYSSIEMNDTRDSFYFITLKEYILKSFIFASINSLFIYSIYFQLARIIKNCLKTILILFLLVVFGIIFVHPYNPFSYLNSNIYLTKEVQLTMQMNINLNLMMVIIFLLSIFFFFLNFLRFEKN